MPSKRSLWHYTAGKKGERVVVYERAPGGVLWGRLWDAERRRYLRRSLRTRDREAAERWALDQVTRLKTGRAVLDSLTVGRLLALYLEHRTPHKVSSSQEQDRRLAELWARVAGGGEDVQVFADPMLWERCIADRLAGRIDARGRPVPPDAQECVSERTAEAGCVWMCWVLNWATYWRDRQTKRRLLDAPPVRLKSLRAQVPNWPDGDRNVRRPIATADRYERLRAVAHRVGMLAWEHGKRVRVQAYFAELLDLAWDTGHRLSSILNLRHGDYLVDAEDEHGRRLPYGALRWRREFDKSNRERVTPLGPIAQAAILRLKAHQPGIGDAPLFPSRDDPTKPLDRRVARHWLLQAEALANLPTQDGSAWHAFRRGWATGRMHQPAALVAEAGGWKNVEIMQRCYQDAPASGMLDVVLHPADVREKHA